MTRVIDTAILDVINNSSNIPLAVLVRAELQGSTLQLPPWGDNILRFTSAAQSIYWDEVGGGDVEYLGAGNLMQINEMQEGTALQAYGLEIKLSGITDTPEVITDIKNAKYKNGKVVIYLAVLDNNYTVINGNSGPIVLFAGRMDTMTIGMGVESEILVKASSRLADWERPRGGRYNSASQNRYYDFSLDPTAPWYRTAQDRGFDHVEGVRNKDIWWGGEPPTERY